MFILRTCSPLRRHSKCTERACAVIPARSLQQIPVETYYNEKTFPGPDPQGTLSFQVIPVDALDIVFRGTVFVATFLNS